MGPEHLQPPLLTSQPGDDPRLDAGEVSIHQLVSRRGDKGRADELGQGIRNRAVHGPQLLRLQVLDRLPCPGQISDVGTREVLDLHQPPSPPPGPVGPVELEQAPDTSVGADSGLDSVILLGAGLAQLLTDSEHPLSIARNPIHLQGRGHGIFPQVRKLQPPGILQPAGELSHAVGVLQPGDGHGLGHELVAGVVPNLNSAMHHVHIYRDTTGVDAKVSLPLLLNVGRHREPGQPPLNLHLGHNIALAVGLEQRPLLRVMLREVPGTAPIALCGGAGDAEVADEGLAHRQLLLLSRKAQGLPGGIQTGGVAAVQPMKHRVPPLIYRQDDPEIFRQTVPLERGVVSVFDVGRVADSSLQPVRQHLAAGKVDDFHRAAVQTVGEQQNLEVRALDILVGPGCPNRNTAEGLQVNTEMPHSPHLSAFRMLIARASFTRS